ncbi:VOC family protein [Microvirga terrae]|uniref:VOC family protein n=1 Tax=Microvirga terrae TaxID=2740529 RepID=A0ABY5RTQ8_9HYPH|nr:MULTISPECIES: VOC family protein [Microvirga]MBQ0824548.1 VOC family protein [Microvirga sp. HBU67558]UVF19344.1 VOC family protein [Microvirga terrae]
MAGRGLHHVTLISSDAERSCRFYACLLGMRLVKRTVSHEDPGTFHLCFGDEVGRPGTLFTLFPWQRVPRGRRGACEAWQTAFRIPLGALDWWKRRFQEADVPCGIGWTGFGEPCLMFEDPDGAMLALVEAAAPVAPEPRNRSDVPAAYAIQGLHDLVLKVRLADPLSELFREILDFNEIGRRGQLVRLAAHDQPGGTITLDEAGLLPRGQLGAGSIHHVAIRARDALDQDSLVRALHDRYGIVATESKDRIYYRSVNFRSTCGLLLELATDGPGFDIDENSERLGMSLKLPPSLEERRGELELLLPSLPLPTSRRHESEEIT